MMDGAGMSVHAQYYPAVVFLTTMQPHFKNHKYSMDAAGGFVLDVVFLPFNLPARAYVPPDIMLGLHGNADKEITVWDYLAAALLEDVQKNYAGDKADKQAIINSIKAARESILSIANTRQRC